MKRQIPGIARWAWSALGAFLLFVGTPSAVLAQTAITLVTNISSSGSSASGIVRASTPELGQQFTTGADSMGYTLTTVDVFLSQIHTGDEPTLSVRTNTNNDLPGTSLFTLSAPDPVTNGSNTFTAPTGSTLDPNTKYHIVMGRTSGEYHWRSREGTNEDAGSAADWSIADKSTYRAGTTWTKGIAAFRHRMTVKGYSNNQDDASLRSLSTSTGRLNESAGTYGMRVRNSAESTKITATPNATGATVTFIDDNGVETTATSKRFTLSEGRTSVQIKVTAPNGTTEQTLALHLVREHAKASATDNPNVHLKANYTAHTWPYLSTTAATVAGARAQVGDHQPKSFTIDGTRYYLQSVTWAGTGNDDVDANTLVACHGYPTMPNGVRQRLKLSLKRNDADIGTFRFGDATRTEQGYGSICWQWSRPSALAFGADANYLGDKIEVTLATDPARPNHSAVTNSGFEAYQSGDPLKARRPVVRVGRHLTVSMQPPGLTHPRGISDRNGLTRAKAGEPGYGFQYQWIKTKDGVETRIDGATTTRYSVDVRDREAEIAVEVSFRDDDGYQERVRTPAARVVWESGGPIAAGTGVEVFSGTLTPGAVGTGFTGCNNEDSTTKCSSTTYLSNDDIKSGPHDHPERLRTESATHHSVERIVQDNDSGTLTFSITPSPGRAVWEYTLVVGDVRLPLSSGADYEASIPTSSFTWLTDDVELEVGTPVTVKLIRRREGATTGRSEFDAALTAYDERVRNGNTEYRFDFRLTKKISLRETHLTGKPNPKYPADPAFTVTNGTITRAKAIDGRKLPRNRISTNHWRLTVTATDPSMPTIVTLPSRLCEVSGSICTDRGQWLRFERQVILGTSGIAVAVGDAAPVAEPSGPVAGTGSEGSAYPELRFPVTLSQAVPEGWIVQVRYETVEETTDGVTPGTAVADGATVQIELGGNPHNRVLNRGDYVPINPSEAENASGSNTFTWFGGEPLTTSYIRVRVRPDERNEHVDTGDDTVKVRIYDATAHPKRRDAAYTPATDDRELTISDKAAVGTITDPTSMQLGRRDTLLTATFGRVDTGHGGNAITVPLTFSEAFPVTAEQIRAGLDVGNGTITGVTPATEGQTQNWSISITPTTESAPVFITLQPKESCNAENAICSDGEPLAYGIALMIQGRAATRITSARITGDPGENGTWDTGEAITGEITFNRAVGRYGDEDASPSIGISLDGTTRRANITSAFGNPATTHRFRHTVGSADNGAKVARVVANSITLDGATFSDKQGGQAETGFSTPGIAIADASATEGGNADFTITLAPAATEDVSVAYTTSDGTATSADYTAQNGTVTFAAGETSKTVSVPALADEAEEDVETFHLALSAPTGAHSYLARTKATGTITDGEPAEEETALTATFASLPTDHDGSTFTFEVQFSESFKLPYLRLRDHAFTVTGGRVTAVKRTDNPHNERNELEANQNWRITVEPSGTDEVAITLNATTDCSGAQPICTEDGRALTDSVAGTVPHEGAGSDAQEPQTPFTVALSNMPVEHDGSTAVTFKVGFSKEPATSYSFRTLRDHTLDLAQGDTSLNATKAKRDTKGSNQNWTITVTPVSKKNLAVAIDPAASCTATGAVCTEGGQMLENSATALILGPPSLSIADARGHESNDRTIDFTVTLNRPLSSTVNVDYATSDGTATAGADYTETSGTLVFTPEVTEKTISVPLIDDVHNEDEETFTLTLSNPIGGNAWIADGEAIGTIENFDVMPQAWLARFGRTIASQAVEAIGGRLETDGASHLSIAGQEVGFGAKNRLADFLAGMAQQAGEDGSGLDPDAMMLGSAFQLSAGGEGGAATFTGWGRFATDGFEAEADNARLDGKVTSGFFGADMAREDWLTGLAVSTSGGDGTFEALDPDMDAEGEVESTMTTLYPYGRLSVTDTIDVWGFAGWGSGELTLTEGPRGEAKRRHRTDVAMRMGALGARGEVISAREPGDLQIDLKSDAFWVRTTSDAVSGSQGNLGATKADVTRLRVGLEGSRAMRVGPGILTPALETSARRDWGDAETGTGLEVGANLRYDAGRLSMDISARSLIAHDDTEYREWGASGSIALRPTATGRGLSLSLTPTWGTPGSRSEQVWSAGNPDDLSPDYEAYDGGHHLHAEMGYGLGLGLGASRGLLTPFSGLSLDDAGGRTLRAGTRWQIGPDTTLALVGTETRPAEGEAERAIRIQGVVRF